MYKPTLTLLVLAFLMFCTTSSAQEWRAGVHGGVTASKLGYYSGVPGSILGGGVERTFGKHFSLQLAVRYVESRYAQTLRFGDGTMSKATLTDKYLQIPANMRFRILGNKLSWKAGLGLAPSVLYNTTLKGQGINSSFSNGLPRFDVAGSLCLISLEYKLNNKFSLGMEHDLQYYFTPYPFAGHLWRQSLFLTSSYRLK